MITWTRSARSALEHYLKGTRHRLAAANADAEEVVADLRNHIEIELARDKSGVVTEQDVEHVIGRVGDPVTDSGIDFEPGPDGIATADQRPRKLPRWNWSAWCLLVGGILLPLAALLFEWFTGMCGAEFFDPIPTPFHLALVALVPMVNLWALFHKTAAVRPLSPPLWWAHAGATGVAAFYGALFLPMLPFSLIGVLVMGLGLLPIAPLTAFWSALVLRPAIGLEDPLLQRRLRWQWWAGFSGIVVLLVGIALPTWLTRPLANRVVSGSEAEAFQALRWLRAWGDSDLLLRDSYGRREGPVEAFVCPALHPESARLVYFQVTGKQFNAVPPPTTLQSGRNRFLLDMYEFTGLERDSGLGGDSVGGLVKGLSLVGSRIDAQCNADRGWAYMEWILEFRNDHPRTPREARAQIQLPPGAVVSRVTLWVNGEEREAAFAGRAKVREAYQRVAVVQQRDPVLVTVAGPDRILVQCFPVPQAGGVMKVRLGITSPLQLESPSKALLTWPGMVERNFAVKRSLQHDIWLEGSGKAEAPSREFSLNAEESGKFSMRAALDDREFNSPESHLYLGRNPEVSTVAVRLAEGGVIEQRVVGTSQGPPARIALVVDGSREMTKAINDVARMVEGYTGPAELGVWFAQDGAHEVSAGDYSNRAAANLKAKSGVGGQDNLPSLLRAWDWASQRQGAVVLWIHGPQPLVMSSLSGLSQRLLWQSGNVAPRLFDLSVSPSANRIAESIDASPLWITVPRLGSLEQDLDRLFVLWAKGGEQWSFERQWLPGTSASSIDPDSRGSHVVRLWGLEEVLRRIRQRQVADAVTLAGELQLVTPVSGAVVLESAQQFQDAGLTPVDASQVPVVPEPRVTALMVAGAVLLWAASRRKR